MPRDYLHTLTVQELMGHKAIKMTMRYSHLSQQHLQEAVGLLGLSLSGEMQKQMHTLGGIDA